MRVRCWGSRGSIAVSGREYLKYGGDTTCVEVTAASGETIIIDAGTGIRRLGNRLMAAGVTDIHLLITHAHWDHLSGFPFFKPLYSSSTDIRVYGGLPTQASVKNIISKTMTPPYFPIKLEDIHAEISFFGIGNSSVSIGSVSIRTIALNHTNEGVGFRFDEGGRSFVFLTDNELGYEHPTGLSRTDYLEFSRGADLLFHDAEYRPDEYESTRGWGHSVFLDAVELAVEAGAARLGLFHHNQERSDPEIDAMVDEARDVIGARGAVLECMAVAEGFEAEV
ncbi:MAG TPA: MBL fold metallo-hydrolase [Deltaproteobacteria bacterium]|nr:MBL fold metallo-hydrolase [Deltaproteobacteria bacterium]